ncbi:MAG: MotA/TolQ/ExbB proton channel family protein [Gammaproteobacteria bacterium]|jgi:chemotaxis protein MotA|nr:MotA/TolQ/ExbB proton channel family protein [Gammaproteobacteria bacterium]
MDLATLIGLIFGIIVIVLAIITGGDFSTFINVPGLLVVLGGTIAATMIKFSLSDCIYAFKIGLKQAFIDQSVDPEQLIEQIKDMANKARKDGLLALEDEDFTNVFLKKGVQLCVDGQQPEVVSKILSTEMEFSIQRMKLGSRIFSGIGEAAPAFGMVGTLVGLVQMLANMSDPSAIGPSMAVALLTTFYGACIANLMAIPIAEKLQLRYQYDRKFKSLIIEGVLGIVQGESPHVIGEVLTTYMDGDAAGGQAAVEGA